MATPVEMPKLGNTVEECLLASWRKHKGDMVSTGDVIAEIETDKTSFELTAPVDGVLLETFFEEGALVPVFTVICVIGSAGESVEGLSRNDDAQALAGADDPGQAVPQEERVTQLARVVPVNAPALTGQSRLSPRARRFAREHEFYPPSVEGSGPGGRVLEADLRHLAHLSSRVSAPPEHQAGRALPPTDAAPGTGGLVRPPTPGSSAVQMSSVRQKIAKRLRESLTSTAQYTLNSSANAGQLLAVRKKMKGSASTADININDLVVFCTVRALLEVPDLNVEFFDGVVHRSAEVHLAFACDTDRGLVVPVVRDCQDLSLVGLARRMKELATQAVQGSIAVDDLSGGTFTVSNLGSLGVESFTPVLNPPQVAILGVNAILLKPTRKLDGNIEFVDSIGLSLTLDHQVIDGAPGAKFLKVIRDKIEHAESLCTI